jgi:hypothetical protein
MIIKIVLTKKHPTMKKKLLLLFSVCGLSVVTSIAQTNPIPNGNFESWTSSNFNTPQNFIESSNSQAFSVGLPFNVIKTTDKYQGSYAIQLTTETAGSDTLFAYIVNDTADGDPNDWHGGFPYTQTPTGVQGYYKSNIPVGDSALFIVAFSNAGTNIGTYIVKFAGTQASYTTFSLTFSPALPSAPDSVMIAITSSNVFANTAVNGSTITLDNISFTGVGSQPALFDGNFENWQNTIVNKPNDWFLQNDGGSSTSGGAYKTTDAYKGSYAIELITYEGDNDGSPVSRAGVISTGWYPNCDSNCTEQGGYPFSNQVDTLAFYYKYVPVNSDSAQVSLNFKKNDTSITFGVKTLYASASYQYVEVPFIIGQTPDTVIVNIRSTSAWDDTLLSFVGSNLKIDNIHFKSQNVTHTHSPTACSVVVGTQTYSISGTYTNTLTGINGGYDSLVTTHLTVPTTGCTTGIATNNAEADITIYPNPVSTIATIEIGSPINLKGAELVIVDVYGKTSKRVSITSYTTTFDRSDLASGVYFYKLITGDGEVVKTGKLLVE